MTETVSKVLKSTGTCPGCGGSICVRTVLNTLGSDVIIVTSNVCAGGASFRTTYPGICQMFTNAGSVAGGVANALSYQNRKEITVVAFAGDGGTADIGLQAVSGAAERNDNLLYICNDNEAYMNTRGQKSGTTPWGAVTTTTPDGKKTAKKNMPMIMAHHDIPYVATATISHPRDLARKVKKAAAMEGFKYIHVFTPCPTGWGYKPEFTAEIGDLAVKSGVFPLYEIIDGRLSLTHKQEKLEDVGRYIALQRRFSALTEKDIDSVRKSVERKWENLANGRFIFG
jgi:pyruvate/2-oxoacid:ferredoxin oxidoreductase beta subunit